MHVLDKDEPATWWNGSGSSDPPSNLDQVIAAEQMTFKDFGGGALIQVNGWPKEPDEAAKDLWISEYSDHGCLYLEVDKV